MPVSSEENLVPGSLPRRSLLITWRGALLVLSIVNALTLSRRDRASSIKHLTSDWDFQANQVRTYVPRQTPESRAPKPEAGARFGWTFDVFQRTGNEGRELAQVDGQTDRRSGISDAGVS